MDFDAIDHMQEQTNEEWKQLAWAEKELYVSRAIIGLAYDEEISLQSRQYIQRLICRLDDYELLISQQHEALKHMIAQRDETED